MNVITAHVKMEELVITAKAIILVNAQNSGWAGIVKLVGKFLAVIIMYFFNTVP